MSTAEIAEVYGVSEALVEFRMRITGVQVLLPKSKGASRTGWKIE